MFYMKKKKFLAAIIGLSMILSSLSLPVYAEETESTTVILTTDSSSSGSIIFSDTGITTKGSGVTVTESDGVKTAKISENGTYSISGKGSSMGISIDDKLSVTLKLSDLTIDNTGNSDLIFIKGEKSTINIQLDGTSEIEGGKNVIKGKKSEINISGDGSITAASQADDAINAKNGTVNISGGTITITECGGDGIQAEDVEISGGTLNIDTWFENAATNYYSNDSYSEGSDTSVNYLWEERGDVKYERVNVDTGSHKGIKAGTKAKTISFADGTADEVEEASGSLKITGGIITIDTTKSGLKANSLSGSSYTSTKAGTYIIGSPDDAIGCNNDIEISGGTINISSADDGISSMNALTITGNTKITINTAYEGIEAKTINIGNGSDDPQITISSADDGINTSGKTLTYTYDTYAGYDKDDEINYTKKSASSSSGNNMTVNSGTITISIDSEGTRSVSLPDGSLSKTKTVTFKPSGDGIDCNGSLTQNRGEIYVYGQSSGDNSPIDTNDGYTYNSGAKILGTGVDPMNECSPEKGSGSYITYGNSNNDGFPGGMPGEGEFPGGGTISKNGPSGGPGNSGTPGNGEAPGNNNGNTPPEKPENDTTDGNVEIQADSESTAEGEFPGGNGEFPGGNGEFPGGNGEFPGGNGGFPGGNGEFPGGSTENSFSAGQYWAVVDSDNKVVDHGQLKYSGSFIIYGSDLLSDGEYTLTVTDSEPENDDVIEVPEKEEKEDDPNKDPESVSKNEAADNKDTLSKNGVSGNDTKIVKGSFTIGDYSYEYQYTDDLSYTGKKQPLSDLTINGQDEGSTLSGNVIFKKVKYKNNKAVGTGKAIPVFKAEKGADSSVKKAVKTINKEFKKNPLAFSISRCALDAGKISGTAVYNSEKGKWKFSLKQEGSSGTVIKLKYKANGKGDFTVNTETLDSTNGTVTITGVNNFTGTATIPVTIQ